MNEKNDFIAFMHGVVDDMFDLYDFGGDKHGDYMGFMDIENFKEENRKHMFGHLEEYYVNDEYADDETWLCHLINVICRCGMEMYRDEIERKGHCD